ncbi:MAG TPA: hypothetical protein PLU88_11770 [Armatimonadota bacterium]|nr:hypothetical protein [Armatimonadota bacterium]HOP80899.1 hypothetical protein [Armatimonadota bacterium]HPP75789.1 hypothetical protein [Armatimonadota bacterium]
MDRKILKKLLPEYDWRPLVFGKEAVVFSPVDKLPCDGADASCDGSSPKGSQQT